MNNLDAARLMAEIRANRERLDSCKRHQFMLGVPPYKLNEERTCLNCGGKMRLLEIGAYINGYKAAGRNPVEVAPDYC